MMDHKRDHGGGLDAAILRFGGDASGWLDLSTGINPVPYPLGTLSDRAWNALPDANAQKRLQQAARRFWNVPDGVKIIATPGLSSAIVKLPELSWAGRAHIPRPTYNEYAAAYRLAGQLYDEEPDAPVRIFVHPNNPDGQLWRKSVVWDEHKELTVIDESFCDVTPAESHVSLTGEPGILVLKSFGKFWGLAGLRLGFVIGTEHTMARPGHGAEDPVDLAELFGPWPVSGPALEIGAIALEDIGWAEQTRQRLRRDAERLDRLMKPHAKVAGGTDLFRLYEVDDAEKWQTKLAERQVWSRIFPYSRKWLRLGLPHPDRWEQLEDAISGAGDAR